MDFKFKKGEQVRIRPDLSTIPSDSGPGIIHGMKIMAGRVYKIQSVIDDVVGVKWYRINGYSWDESWLLPLQTLETDSEEL